jgi:hypothetical protein
MGIVLILRIHKQIEAILSPFILLTILNNTSALCLMVSRLARDEEVGIKLMVRFQNFILFEVIF